MPPAPAALALSPGEVSPHGWLPTGGRRSNKCSAPLGARWGNVGWLWDHICHRCVSRFRVLVALAEAIFKSLYFKIFPMPSSRTRRVNLGLYPRSSPKFHRSNCWHQGVKSDPPPPHTQCIWCQGLLCNNLQLPLLQCPSGGTQLALAQWHGLGALKPAVTLWFSSSQLGCQIQMQTPFISLWMSPYVTTEVTTLTSGLIFSFVSLLLLIVYLFIYLLSL